jgi:hypothetical protein
VAPPKVKNPKESAQYYRDNPEARKKKAETTKKLNDTPENKEYRAELSRERRKRGIMGKGGNDLSHTKDGKLVEENPSTNRARNRGKK